MNRELAIACAGNALRAAIVEDGMVVDLIVEPSARASLVGNLYIGRVRRLAPGLAAAFVDIGLPRDGFLPLARRRDGETAADASPPPLPDEGAAVLVQVARDATRTKGPQLSSRISLAGCYLVYLPDGGRIAVSRLIEDETERLRLEEAVHAAARPGEGFVVRTAAEGVGAGDLARDAVFLRANWAEIVSARAAAPPPALLRSEPDAIERVLRDHALRGVEAIRLDDPACLTRARAFCARFAPEVAPRLSLYRGSVPLFDALGIEEAIEGALLPRVALPSGGCIFIEATEALTAIDVNSGSLTGSANPAEMALRTNLEAAAETARQIRLRNLGGMIVVDFISMDDAASWSRVLDALAAGLARDRTRARLFGRTAAGLVEIARRRQRIPLAEALTESCAGCAGTGRVSTPETVAQAALRRLRQEARTAPGGTLVVTACTEVVAAIETGYPGGIVALGAALGRRIVLNAAPGAAREAIDLHVE